MTEGELEGALLALPEAVGGVGWWRSTAAAAPSASAAGNGDGFQQLPEGHSVHSFATHVLESGLNPLDSSRLAELRESWGPQVAQEC
ncbi:MAG: hypothetical protein NWP79_01920, partial [Paracoccaceae bacterium]|nr:hypothetical protein [Paracoccaceae bacterium]